MIGSVDWAYSKPMDKYFSALDAKVDRVIAQCDWLRSENHQLRQMLAIRTEELRVMGEKMDEARQRLERLLQVSDVV